MNKIRGRARQKLKGSIRKLKHLQRNYGLNVSQQKKLNELIELLNEKEE